MPWLSIYLSKSSKGCGSVSVRILRGARIRPPQGARGTFGRDREAKKEEMTVGGKDRENDYPWGPVCHLTMSPGKPHILEFFLLTIMGHPSPSLLRLLAKTTQTVSQTSWNARLRARSQSLTPSTKLVASLPSNALYTCSSSGNLQYMPIDQGSLYCSLKTPQPWPFSLGRQPSSESGHHPRGTPYLFGQKLQASVMFNISSWPLWLFSSST